MEIYGKEGGNYSRVKNNSLGGGNIIILETDKLFNVELLDILDKYLENCWDILVDLIFQYFGTKPLMDRKD